MDERDGRVAETSASRPGIGLVVSILVLASSISIMSTDMYTPSLPDLADWFDTDATMVKLTISLNMLAFGLAQLVHGPLSDRFGRRPVLLCSLVAVAILCLACAAAQSIAQLIIARVLLGLAAGAEAVVGLAIIKDLYNEKDQVKALALLGMVIAVTPAAAPILGGYIHVAFGWQANFHIIAATALLVCLIAARWLPESSRPDVNALQWRAVLQGYTRLLHNSDFLIHTAMLGVALGLIFVFVTAAPFVLIERMQIPTEHFGYYQAGIVLSFFLGSVLASRLADLRDPGELLCLGVCLIATGAAVTAFLIVSDQARPVSLTLGYAIMTFGMGPLFAVAPSRALRSIHAQAGTASAMLSGIEQCMAGMAAVLISVLHDGSARPMAWMCMALALLLIALFVRSRRPVQPRGPAV